MSQSTPSTSERMSKDAWIDAATKRLLPLGLTDTRAYAEELYKTFVIDFGDPDCTPDEAVDEDLSNWGD